MSDLNLDDFTDFSSPAQLSKPKQSIHDYAKTITSLDFKHRAVVKQIRDIERQFSEVHLS